MRPSQAMTAAPRRAPRRAGTCGRRRLRSTVPGVGRPGAGLIPQAGILTPVLSTLGDGLWNAVLMAWEVWWALVLGFFVSAVVQAWVPRQRIEAAMAGEGLGAIARATGLGAASSSCSYAAVAIAKSLFQKGASAAAA